MLFPSGLLGQGNASRLQNNIKPDLIDLHCAQGRFPGQARLDIIFT